MSFDGKAAPIRGAIKDGDTVTANVGGLPAMGSDGTNFQFICVDSNGYIIPNGLDADGAPITANPIVIAGKDPSGNVAIPCFDATGALIVSEGSASTPAQQCVDEVTVVSGAAEATILTYANSSGSQKNINLVDVECFGLCIFRLKIGAAASEATVATLKTSQQSPDAWRDFTQALAKPVPNGEQAIITAELCEELTTAEGGDATASACVHYY